MPQLTANEISCVLEGVAQTIRKFGIAARNRCPWVSYVNKAGRVCSHFIARAKFSGYHFNFSGGAATVTNLETGKQYTVSLTPPCCTCEAFKYSQFPKPPCKHVKMVAELEGGLEQVIVQHELRQHLEAQAQVIAPKYAGINEQDLPKGFSLQRTEDHISLEFNLFIRVVSSVKGVPTLITKCVGRLIEGMNGSIQAYRLRSGVYRSFATTLEAAKYLISSCDYSLKEVAEAFDAWNEPALDF